MNRLNKNAKMGIIGVFILIIGIFLVVVGNSIATPDSTVLRDQEVDNLGFKNASVEYVNKISTYEVDVTNNLDITYNLKYVNIKITTDDNEEYNLIGYIGEKLESRETRKITASIDQDITNIIGIEYTIIK